MSTTAALASGEKCLEFPRKVEAHLVELVISTSLPETPLRHKVVRERRLLRGTTLMDCIPLSTEEFRSVEELEELVSGLRIEFLFYAFLMYETGATPKYSRTHEQNIAQFAQ